MGIAGRRGGGHDCGDRLAGLRRRARCWCDLRSLNLEGQKEEKEAAAKVLFDEQEAKANEAAAALLADLDAEDQRAAAAAAGKKKAKNANKKEAGCQHPVASARSVADQALGLEESKADEKKLAPRQSSQKEEEEHQQQHYQEQVEEEAALQRQQQRRRRRRGAPKEEAAVAAAMSDMSLKDDGAPFSAMATREGQGKGGIREKDLEEEKHDFLFDGAPDSLKCSVAFCLMTEAVLAMDEFSYQKSSLEGHIAHCAAKGLPLTSPLTGEPMGGIFIPNQNLRTLVKDYIAQRETEWELHLVQRRAAAAEVAKSGKKR